MERNVDLARKAIIQCLNIREGENVWIQSWNHTVDLASKIALVCLENGAQPFITLNDENYWIRSLQEASKSFLETLPPIKAAALEQTDAFIFMIGPSKPINWNKIPSEKQELTNMWYLESNKFMDSWRMIARKRQVRMLGIEYCIATPEMATSLGLNYDEWKAVLLDGCLADQQQITQKSAELAKIMKESRRVSVETSYGTNLEFELAGRDPMKGDSIVTKEDAAKGIVKFLPSGFVEVAPDEDTAEGVAVYNLPVHVHGGKKIEGLTLHFHHGKIERYSAARDVECFEEYLKSTQGDDDKFGFFGLGLNPCLKPGFRQDDKVLGSVTVGIGGNEDKGGKNRTVGSRGWWACMTEARVKFDGKTVLEGTKLMI
ncbi:MAG TPA: aminopeptidase [Candidatus Acidoferrum sp.]|nr:aminopeptidase [Candidatus Acidoferrum sp.]